MKTTRLLLSVVGLSAGLVAACHDDNNNPPTPAPSTNLSLDTAHVLTLAQTTTETSSPLVVNGGAITLNDTSETSSPIAVSAM